MKSQSARLLEYLKSGLTVTRLSALTELGIFELSARVIDIERQGYDIARKRISITNRWGEKASVMEYSL